MSDDQKAIKMPAKKGDNKEKAKNSNKKSIGWIFGVVILILISVTFIIPATAFSGNSTSSGVKFGSYNGKDIELTYNSYFYYQLQNVYNYYAQQVGESNLSNYMYNIYYSAFQNAVVNEEFQAMAAKAGIKPTSSQISDAIVKSGYYSDGSSTFSSEVYANATDAQKEQIVGFMQAYVPFEEVEATIKSAKVSSAETDFIASLSASPRSFEYIYVGPALYPAEAAAAYAEGKADLFKTVSFVRATYATEEEAGAAFTALAAGAKTMEEAVAESIDGSQADGGVMEDVYRFVLDDYFSNTGADAAVEIFAADANSLVGPVHTMEGYTIFSITKAAEDFDVSTEEGLNAVRTYINNFDKDNMTAALEVIAQDVYAEAKANGLGAAAAKYGANVNTVNNAAENPADSQYVVSFNYADVAYDQNFQVMNGSLYTATKEDKDYSSKLFSAAEGSVLEPQPVDAAFIVVSPVAATSDNEATIELIKSYYGSATQTSMLSDYENSILNSDKVSDEFVGGFLKAVYGM